MHRPTLGVLAALTTVTGCVSIGLICTEIGCSSGMLLDLQSGAPLEAGAYELTVDGDGGFSTTCLFDVSDLVDDCDGDAPCVITDTCFELTWTRTVDDLIDLSVRLDTTDAELDVALLLDGAVLVEETLTPAYEEFEPNGKGCDPVCLSAQESVAF